MSDSSRNIYWCIPKYKRKRIGYLYHVNPSWNLMEFVKFNFKHFSFLNFLDIFVFTLIFRIAINSSENCKFARVQLMQLISLWRLISKTFVFLGRFGILEPIQWPFRYSQADSVGRFGISADSVVVSVFLVRFGILTHPIFVRDVIFNLSI